MFVKIEGSLINLDLVYNIDLNDDGTATLWFTGTENASRDVTEADLSVIINAIRHECTYEEIEPPATATHSVVDTCKAIDLPIAPVPQPSESRTQFDLRKSDTLCRIANALEKIEVNNRGR